MHVKVRDVSRRLNTIHDAKNVSPSPSPPKVLIVVKSTEDDMSKGAAKSNRGV